MADNDSNSFLWFLAGLGVGAVIGVLYAPASGAETRDTIRNKATEGRDYVTNQAQRAKDTASQWVDKSKDIYSQQKEQFRSAFAAGRQAYEQATSEGGATTPGTTGGPNV
jgi:gas vesicle protein